MLDKQEYQQLLEETQIKVNQGSSQNDILADLAEQKISVIDAIKVTKDLYFDSLFKAKEAVSVHPAWEETVDEYEKFHDALENNLHIEED